MNKITTCPHCSTRIDVPKGITARTTICPHCLADVDNPQSSFQIPVAGINSDVKRDLSRGSIVLAVLIGLCLLGIVLAFFLSLYWKMILGVNDVGILAACVLVLFAALDVLVSVLIVRGLFRWGISGTQVPLAAKVTVGIFLSLGTFVAVVIFFLITCGVLGALNQSIKSP